MAKPVIVTIRNDLSVAIYAPNDLTYCSIVNVQRLEEGQWVAESPSTTSCPASWITIAPKSAMKSTVGLAMQESGAQGPMVSEPSTSSPFQKDLRILPTIEPWKPGDLLREVPKGASPPGKESPRFGALKGKMSPGRYRIEFSFQLGSMSGPAQKVYSEEFVVTD